MARRPGDIVWAEIHYQDRVTGFRVRYERMTRAQAQSHSATQRIHETDPTPEPADDEPIIHEGKRITEAEAIKLGLHHREADWKRELHNRYNDRKIERDESTFIVDEINPSDGERHVETLYMKKSMPFSEKRKIVAAAYARAGKPVDPNKIVFFQE